MWGACYEHHSSVRGFIPLYSIYCCSRPRRKITGTLGISPTLEEVDLYTEIGKFPLVYDASTDPTTIEEMDLMAKETTAEVKNKGSVDSESDVTDGEDVE
jgi:hypothetical protein